MACTSFTDCISDPLSGTDAATNFGSLSSTAIFSINLALTIFYVLLVVAVVWFIFKGIYAIIGADSSDSYEKFRGAITNAVFAAIGIALLAGGSRFLLIVVLKLFGIDGEENIFMDAPLNDLFDI